MVELLVVGIAVIIIASLMSLWIHREQGRANSKRPRAVLVLLVVLAVAAVAAVTYSLAR